MADLPRIIADIMGRSAEDRRRQVNMIRTGIVVQVDPARHRVKVDLGCEGHPLPTPWIGWAACAGVARIWTPPDIGTRMTVLSPAGEIDEKSLALYGGYTPDHPAPSTDGAASQFTFGALSVTATTDGLTVRIGDVTLDISGAGLAVSGGRVTHNGTDIGDTHTHGGIRPGPANTGPPA